MKIRYCEDEFIVETEPVSILENIRDLQARGWSLREIAEKEGTSVAYVKVMLDESSD